MSGSPQDSSANGGRVTDRRPAQRPAAGSGRLAQISDHGDPALLGLDAVDELPAKDPVGLAVTVPALAEAQ